MRSSRALQEVTIYAESSDGHRRAARRRRVPAWRGWAFGETSGRCARPERHAGAKKRSVRGLRVAFVHEEAGRAREIVGPAIAYQRTRYAEWGTDRENPRPDPIREEGLPWERYLVGTPEEVAEGLISLYREAPYDHFCFWGRLPGVTHEQALRTSTLREGVAPG